MTIEITTTNDAGGTEYHRWRAEHEGRLLVSRSYESLDQCRREADELAPALFRIVGETRQDTALYRLAKLTAWMIREGKVDQALALNDAVEREVGWVP